MSAVKQLYQLQEVEQEIEALEKEIASIEAQLSGNEALVKTRSEIAGLEAKIGEIKKAQRDNEAETTDITAKIATSEKELYDGRNANPKELVNLQIEIDGLKSRRSEFESKQIGVIEELDRTTTALTAARENLARLESEWQGMRIDLTKKVEDLRVHLAGMNARRGQLTAAIAPDAVACYYRVKKQKGIAVAKIEQGFCKGCRIQLPAREIQQARGNRIVQCSSCGRLLFMP
jgi:uncharacterized protein